MRGTLRVEEGTDSRDRRERTCCTSTRTTSIIYRTVEKALFEERDEDWSLQSSGEELETLEKK